jgi:aryl-alcohol dehydrogenase-like predicted oxidoreductase
MLTARTRKLGSTGPEVFPIALGCMGMSGMYGHADERESIATIQEAVDSGVTLIDTGDFYNSGLNEVLVGRALKGRRDRVLLSVKFGALRDPAGGWSGYDARPAAAANFLAYSLNRLGTDHIDIYRPARVDAVVPIEDTVGAIAGFIERGWVRHIGLSEAGADTIRRAASVHPITDLQIEYSLISRGPEEKIFPALRETGAGLTAYGVLSRGLLTGSRPGAGDFRANMPRFRGDNFDTNQKLAAALQRIAADRNATAAQIAIAWVLAQEEFIVPVIGARTRAQLRDALGALELRLSADELTQIAQAVPASAVAGTRYEERLMQWLDSER